MKLVDAIAAPVDRAKPWIWSDIQDIGPSDQGLAPTRFRELGFSFHGATGVLSWPEKVDGHLLGWQTQFRIGPASLMVWSTKSLLDEALFQAGYSPIGHVSDEKMLGLVVEHLLGSLIEQIETLWGKPVTVLSHGKTRAVAGSSALGFKVALDCKPSEHHSSLLIEGPSVALNWLRNAIEQAAEQRMPKLTACRENINKLPICLSLRGRHFLLKRNQVNQLDVGDGLILSGSQDAISACNVLIADWLTADVSFSNGRYEMVKSPKPVALAVKTKETDMHPDMALDQLDEMPVKISIELARTRISLGDLNELVIGSILPFKTDLPKDVVLLANGEPFADAELVQVNGSMAVRLAELR